MLFISFIKNIHEYCPLFLIALRACDQNLSTLYFSIIILRFKGLCAWNEMNPANLYYCSFFYLLISVPDRTGLVVENYQPLSIEKCYIAFNPAMTIIYKFLYKIFKKITIFLNIPSLKLLKSTTFGVKCT